MTDAELLARLRGRGFGLMEEAADRIEALTKERDEADDLAKAAFADGASNNIRLAETSYRVKWLEAKLAKAVEGQKVNALEQILEERGAVFDAMVDAAEDAAGKDVSFNVVVGRALRAAIAEIKGESHE